MADGAERPEFEIVATSGTFDDEGGPVMDRVIGFPTGPMTEVERRFSIAEQTGIAPEDLQALGPIGGRAPEDGPTRQAGRVSVSFGNWNSSWVPEIDKDKDDGPILN